MSLILKFIDIRQGERSLNQRWQYNLALSPGPPEWFCANIMLWSPLHSWCEHGPLIVGKLVLIHLKCPLWEVIPFSEVPSTQPYMRKFSFTYSVDKQNPIIINIIRIIIINFLLELDQNNMITWQTVQCYKLVPQLARFFFMSSAAVLWPISTRRSYSPFQLRG